MIEGRLLRDQCRDHVRIEFVGVGVLLDQRPVGQREDDLQQLRRQLLSARRQELRIGAAHHRDRSPQLPFR